MPNDLDYQLTRAVLDDKPVSQIKNLIEQGANPNTSIWDSGPWSLYPVLFYAVYKRRPDLVQCLLEGHAVVSMPVLWGSWKGWSIVNCAVYWNYPEITNLLLKSGGGLYEKFVTGEFKGWEPLQYAVYHGYTELVRVLLSNGACAWDRIPKGKHQGLTLLEYAVKESRKKDVLTMAPLAKNINPEIVALLARHGGNENNNNLLESVLTTKEIHPSISINLIRYGNPHQTFSDGKTTWYPLQYAVYYCLPGLVEDLLLNGADPEKGRLWGKSLIDYAKQAAQEPKGLFSYLYGGAWYGFNLADRQKVWQLLIGVGIAARAEEEAARRIRDEEHLLQQSVTIVQYEEVVRQNAVCIQAMQEQIAKLRTEGVSSKSQIHDLQDKIAQLEEESSQLKAENKSVKLQESLLPPCSSSSSPSAATPSSSGMFSRQRTRQRTSAASQSIRGAPSGQDLAFNP